MRSAILITIISIALAWASSAQTISLTNAGVSNLPGINSSFTTLVDVNNNGLLDIFISGKDGANIFTTIYINNGDGTFSPQTTGIEPLHSVSADWADYNNNGYADLLISGLTSDGTRRCKVYINDGSGMFTDLSAGLVPVAHGAVAWGDFNCNGRKDIFISGIDGNGNRVSIIYRNTGNGFEDTQADIMGVSDGGVLCFDYNNNGLTDIILTGLNSSGQKINNIYINNGQFSFTSLPSGMDGITMGSISRGDFNNDGYQDILLTGLNHAGQIVTKIYKYNNGGYVEAAVSSLKGLMNGASALVDLNNNGLLDIVINGSDSEGYYSTTIYSNNNDETFTLEPLTLPGVITGHLAFGDLFNNGKIDLLISGLSDVNSICRVYENVVTAANALPSAPSSLLAFAQHDSVRLSWGAGSDTETPQNAITYNLYIGTEPLGLNILSPLANLTSGKRRIFATGQQLSNTSVVYRELDEGVYYWSVQSIDNAYQGSGFAPEQSFAVCHSITLGPDTSVCYNNILELSVGTDSDTVNWYSSQHGLLIGNSNTLSYHVLSNDTIHVSVAKPQGCTVYDTLIVTMIPLPDFTLGNDTMVCYNDTITLTPGINWFEVEWYALSNNTYLGAENLFPVKITTDSSIYVRVADEYGCFSFDTIAISMLELPQFSLGRDTSVCHYDTLYLTLPDIYPLVEWHSITEGLVQSNGAAYSHHVLNTDTIFSLVTDIYGCSNSDSIRVFRYDLPQPFLGLDTSICFNQPIELTVGSGWLSIEWLTQDEGAIGSGSDSITLPILKDEELWVMVTDSNGCSNLDTILITVMHLPLYDIGPDTAICYNETILLTTGSGWESVEWYGNNGSDLLHNGWFYSYTSHATNTIVSVVTDQNHCVNTDTITITSLQLPEFDIGQDTAICKLDSIYFTPGLGWESVLWRSSLSGSIGASDTLWILGIETDVYYVEVANSYGCVSNDSITLTVLPLPENRLPLDTIICIYDTLQLNVGMDWQRVDWRTTQGGYIALDTTHIEWRMVEPTVFLAEVTNHYGCMKPDTCQVSIADLPFVSIGNDTIICIFDSIELRANAIWDELYWYSNLNGLIDTNTTNIHLLPEQTDVVTALVIDSLGCRNTNSITINIQQLPVINAGTDTLICYSTQVTLGGNPVAVGIADDFNYRWLPNDTFGGSILSNPQVQLVSTTTYHLEVRDSIGCLSTDSITIAVNPYTEIFLNSYYPVCYGESIRIGEDPITNGESLFPYVFQWYPDIALDNPSSANPTVSPEETTEYALTVTVGPCKTDTAFTTVIVNPLPIVYASPELTIGSKGYIQLYAEGGMEYEWTPRIGLNAFNIPDPVASPEYSTLYTVEVTDSIGCKNSETVMVNVGNMVFVPNLFTPNGDGVNDIFKVYGYGFLELKLTIFDSQNRTVFESIDIDEITNTGWDGTVRGVPAKTGTYRWLLKGRYINGEVVLFEHRNSGIVTLLR